MPLEIRKKDLKSLKRDIDIIPVEEVWTVFPMQ